MISSFSLVLIFIFDVSFFLIFHVFLRIKKKDEKKKERKRRKKKKKRKEKEREEKRKMGKETKREIILLYFYLLFFVLDYLLNVGVGESSLHRVPGGFIWGIQSTINSLSQDQAALAEIKTRLRILKMVIANINAELPCFKRQMQKSE